MVGGRADDGGVHGEAEEEVAAHLGVVRVRDRVWACVQDRHCNSSTLQRLDTATAHHARRPRHGDHVGQLLEGVPLVKVRVRLRVRVSVRVGDGVGAGAWARAALSCACQR